MAPLCAWLSTLAWMAAAGVPFQSCGSMSQRTTYAEPLDGGRAGDELVGESARGTEEAGRISSGGRGEGPGAVADLDHQRPPGERGAVGVAAGMIADLEAVLCQLLGKVRTQILVVADHEHGGRNVLPLQDAECLERLRKLIVVIERQRDTGSVGGAMAHGDGGGDRGGFGGYRARGCRRTRSGDCQGQCGDAEGDRDADREGTSTQGDHTRDSSLFASE